MVTNEFVIYGGRGYYNNMAAAVTLTNATTATTTTWRRPPPISTPLWLQQQHASGRHPNQPRRGYNKMAAVVTQTDAAAATTTTWRRLPPRPMPPWLQQHGRDRHPYQPRRGYNNNMVGVITLTNAAAATITLTPTGVMYIPCQEVPVVILKDQSTPRLWYNELTSIISNVLAKTFGLLYPKFTLTKFAVSRVYGFTELVISK